MTLEAKALAILAALILAISGIVFWSMHERNKGATGCRQEDLDAAYIQLAALSKKVLDYDLQLKTANEQHEKDQELLDAAANTPIPHLVCHTTPSASPVPKVPGGTGSQPTPPGPGDAVLERSFDPGPRVRGVSNVVEDELEKCRNALAKWPKE